MSDEAIAGAIRQLRAQRLESWGCQRLRALEAEQLRREAKRRGKDLIPSR